MAGEKKKPTAKKTRIKPKPPTQEDKELLYKKKVDDRIRSLSSIPEIGGKQITQFEDVFKFGELKVNRFLEGINYDPEVCNLLFDDTVGNKILEEIKNTDLPLIILMSK